MKYRDDRWERWQVFCTGGGALGLPVWDVSEKQAILKARRKYGAISDLSARPVKPKKIGKAVQGDLFP